jgi:hypothetical protein
MDNSSNLKMGTDSRSSVLPVKAASGPGFLGPNYSPADEMLPPASIGVKRGGDLSDVIGAVKGVIYYGDMMGFGEASSGFTSGMPGLKPLGVNYFLNSGLTCSNGATMWEYVQTIPTGSALGEKVKNAIRGVGLPQLRGMAPGILEDAQSALNPGPVINAMVGSGYPQCILAERRVGDFDGRITNVDGQLLVDPEGLINRGGSYYQQRWIQARKPIGKRPGETDEENYARGEQIQLSYDDWNKAPKTHKGNGCVKDIKETPGLQEPRFCNAKPSSVKVITLGDGTTVTAVDGFTNYKEKHPIHKMVSLSLVLASFLGLAVLWRGSGKK